MSKVQAVILAGGQGSRLRPYTTILPKPLMPLDEFPIVEVIIRQLAYYGIKHLVISTGHLAGLIEAFCGNGERWGVSIRYVKENQPLGTAGALQLIENLEDHFLIINGDVLTDLNFKDFFKYHKAKKGIATIAVEERVVKTDFGVIECRGQNELKDYIEKPEHKSLVSMGINILNKRCKRYVAKDERLGMPELMLRMRDRGEKIYCFKHPGMWLDLGRIDDLEQAQDVFRKHKKSFLLT